MKPGQTFFFYDLETSGLNPRSDRIMQFAGQRTTPELERIGEPANFLVRLSEDILPSPDAVMVTKITPQMTRQDGLSEADFAQIFTDEIATPNTVFVGYNNVRFDDEFMRNFLWRNFRDPYEWSWSDGRSRWDLLDVVRLVRALRPDGIKWPTVDGKATNRLELLTRENHLEHSHAHDALSDVDALIAVAKLLRDKQPKMWDYLFKMRDKKAVAKLVNLETPQPFVYASGRYAAEFEKTTVALPLGPGRKAGAAMVYDLRADPAAFADRSLEDLSKIANASWEERRAENFAPLPVKELAYNRCPAVAPLGTLDAAAQKRLQLDLKRIEKNVNYLAKNRGLADKLLAAANSRPDFAPAADVEGQLYDGFAPDADKAKIRAVAAADAQDLADFHPNFADERLPELLLRYKARNFPRSLSADEKQTYDAWRAEKFQREIPKYLAGLARLANNPQNDEFILQELQLWAESIAPAED